MPQWHSRLGFSNLPYAIYKGNLGAEKMAGFMSLLRSKDNLAISAATPEGAKGSVKSCKEQVQIMRDNTKQAISFMTLVMLSSDVHLHCYLINFTSHPFRDLHGLWDKHLRSPVASKDMHFDFVSGRGRYWKAIDKACNPYRRLSELVSVGIAVSCEEVTLQFTRDESEMACQHALAKQMWMAQLHQVV